MQALHGAGAGVLAHGNGEHLEQNAVRVVLGLLFGQAEAVDLNAIAKAALFGIGDAVALLGNLIPQVHERAHLTHLGDKTNARIHEERYARDDAGKVGGVHVVSGFHAVEHGGCGGQRVGEFLFRRRARLLQMIGADVHRVPLRHRRIRVGGNVGDQPERRFGREDIRTAREVFFDNVVLHRALQFGRVRALLLGDRNIKGEQPTGGRVDGH